MHNEPYAQKKGLFFMWARFFCLNLIFIYDETFSVIYQQCKEHTGRSDRNSPRRSRHGDPGEILSWRYWFECCFPRAIVLVICSEASGDDVTHTLTVYTIWVKYSAVSWKVWKSRGTNKDFFLKKKIHLQPSFRLPSQFTGNSPKSLLEAT